MTEETPEPAERWQPMTVEQISELLAGMSEPWWIAGGVALDLFLGHETRPHNDVDVAILRRDHAAFRERLGKWDVQIAHDGAFIRWKRGEPIAREHHEAWARETPSGPWRIELLIEESDADRWIYRRDPELGLNVADLGLRTESGIPYVRPEVQLLYKSKSPRPADETDFLYVLPRLNAAQRSFLIAALWTTSPGHRWLERLK